MYKTLIQLVLLVILILIIVFISKKYFFNEDKIRKTNKDTIIIKKEENLLNNDLIKKNINNEIKDLSYEKIVTNGNKYLIKAKEGTLDSKSPSIIYINLVEASLTNVNNEKIIIYSEKAIFNKENFKTIFSNNVKLIYQDFTLEGDTLEFLVNENIGKFNNNIKFYNQQHTLESNNLDFLIDKNIVIFRDNVRYYNQDIKVFGDTVIINLLTKEIDIKSKKKKKTRMSIKN
jgi:lipopolysaccharide export system protein LptA